MSSKIISHISIIMDGNGRWANQKNMPRAYGHKERCRTLLIKLSQLVQIRQISQLSLFALSSENLNRPDYEVQFLLKLFEDSINKYINDLHSNNVRIKFIGNLESFSSKLLKNISHAEKITKDNTGLKLNFAINYGGQWDIINAVNNMIEDTGFPSKIKKFSVDRS